MDDAQLIIIPTLSKAKISGQLSYPIGAGEVSAALASCVRFPEVKLHFYSGLGVSRQHGHYEFLRVEYLNEARPAAEYPIADLYKRPPQWRWEIIVQPVPRSLRHRIKEYVVRSALPQIEQWLAERAPLAQRGSDILAFFYDESAEEFIRRQLTRLEPLRSR